MRQNRTGQFGWVVLLLATAVILPTVCLLWFMTQAVRNERLAVRQKLVDIYQKKAETQVSHVPNQLLDLNKESIGSIDFRPEYYPGLFAETAKLDGFILFGPDSKVLYPVVTEGIATITAPDSFMAKAWRLEFIDANYVGAARLYDSYAVEMSNPAVVYEARTAQARCLLKAGQTDEAKKVLGEIAAYPPPHLAGNISVIADYIVRARVMLAQLCADTNDVQFETHLLKVTEPDVPCRSQTRMWALERFIALYGKTGLGAKFGTEVRQAAIEIETGEVSLAAQEQCPTASTLDNWPADTVRRLKGKEVLYGMHLYTKHGHMMCVMRPERLRLSALMADISDAVVDCRIYDNEGKLVTGDPDVTTEAFAKASMGKWMPDWKMDLYFRDAGVFEDVARKNAAIYVWVAILVISLIGGVAIASGVSISRQMRLNRLKNDFIATITHELKTPLSSMRVLVDTLLAGDCKDEKQEKEYLELIARENLRLSRLIDNFLTFSRMERNKKAFDIQPCSAAEIVADAAEAVKTKFEQNGCVFEHDLADGLPEAMADHDAAVTVLVNLLDNACKYSGKDKRISLKAFAQDGQVCFEVSDNGYGMTKKVVRRIFERFYQVDQSLSRSAEGCGLGLSIVKFIVDAHDGRIDVRSRPGEGSCFTVRLPAAGCGQS